MLHDPQSLGFEPAAAYGILDNFLQALERFIQGQGVASGVTPNQLLESLLNAIPGIVVEWWRFGARTPELQPVREFIRLAQLIGNMVVHGAAWKFYAFNYTLSNNQRIDLIASAGVGGVSVTVFARAFDFGSNDADVGKVTQALDAIIEFIRARDHEFGPSNDIDVAFGFIGSQTSEAKAQEIINRLKDRGVPVVVVYCIANCNGPNPIYGIKYANISRKEAYAIACAMGFSGFCERIIIIREPGEPGFGGVIMFFSD